MNATPEREKLRAAIENANAAQRLLEEAQVARANASERWSASNQKVGAIEREIEEAKEAPTDSSGDGFIASLAVGGDVAVLDKTKTNLDELHARLEDAERESHRWHEAIILAEQAVESRQRAYELAQHYVDRAAGDVVAKEVNVAALLCHAEGLRNQILDAQSRLAAIARAMDHHSEQRRAVDNFCADIGWLIDTPWRDRPAAQPVRDMLNALKADASTALKI